MFETSDSSYLHDVASVDIHLAAFETSDSSYLHDMASVDIHSAAFASLPPEVQHEILQERQKLERHSYTDPTLLPVVRASLCVCVCVCVPLCVCVYINSYVLSLH